MPIHGMYRAMTAHRHHGPPTVASRGTSALPILAQSGQAFARRWASRMAATSSSLGRRNARRPSARSRATVSRLSALRVRSGQPERPPLPLMPSTIPGDVGQGGLESAPRSPRSRRRERPSPPRRPQCRHRGCGTVGCPGPSVSRLISATRISTCIGLTSRVNT